MEHLIVTKLTADEVHIIWSRFKTVQRRLEDGGDYPEKVRDNRIADKLLDLKFELAKQEIKQ